MSVEFLGESPGKLTQGLLVGKLLVGALGVCDYIIYYAILRYIHTRCTKHIIVTLYDYVYLSLSIYIYICMCMYICVYIYIYIYTCIYMYTCIHIYIYIYIYTIHIHISLSIICIYIYITIHINKYLYIHQYTYAYSPPSELTVGVFLLPREGFLLGRSCEEGDRCKTPLQGVPQCRLHC